MSKQNITTSSGIYQNKDWDNLEFPINFDCVPNDDTAVLIAKNIMSNFQKDGKFQDYIPQSVFFDTQDHVWIVCFYPNVKGYIGADFNIAIKKDNAEVIKMWVQE